MWLWRLSYTICDFASELPFWFPHFLKQVLSEKSLSNTTTAAATYCWNWNIAISSYQTTQNIVNSVLKCGLRSGQ